MIVVSKWYKLFHVKIYVEKRSNGVKVMQLFMYNEAVNLNIWLFSNVCKLPYFYVMFSMGRSTFSISMFNNILVCVNILHVCTNTYNNANIYIIFYKIVTTEIHFIYSCFYKC